MEIKWTMMVLLVATVMVALVGQGVTGAALQEQGHYRHERSRKHIARMQDTIDRLTLKQKIDHILLTNLQKMVQQLLDERNAAPNSESGDAASSPESLLSASVKAVEAEERALSSLGKRVAEVRGTMTEVLQAEEHQDDMTQMRQELAYLRY